MCCNKLSEGAAAKFAELDAFIAGLSIDLDDGVRVNYPKFYPLVEPIKGLDKE